MDPNEAEDFESSSKRIYILSPEEFQALYGLPKFTEQERAIYFSLSPEEQAKIQKIKSAPHKMYFALLLGYFKAKQIFFNFNFQDVEEDMQYILKTHFQNIDEIKELKDLSVESIPNKTRINYQNYILKQFNYNAFQGSYRLETEAKAIEIAAEFGKPIYIFRKLMQFLESKRIVLPGYSTMQDMISEAIGTEIQRLETLIYEQVPDHIKEDLDNLLTAGENLHEITLLRREAKNFSYTQMQKEIGRRQKLKAIYDFAKDFLSELKLSHESLKYYASLVGYYTVYKLRKLKGKKRNQSYLYLLCFVLNRYQKINDNLLKSFIHYVSKYESDAKDFSKDEIAKITFESNRNMKNVSRILDLFLEEELADETEFGEVRKQAFRYIEPDKLSEISKYIARGRLDPEEYKWLYYDQKEPTIKKNLRPIFLNTQFETQAKNTDLMQAVAVFQERLVQKNKSLNRIKEQELPQSGFIPPSLNKYMYEKVKIKKGGKTIQHKVLRKNRYEAYMNILLKNGLESGDIYSRESLSFKSLEDDLISKSRWESERENLLKKAGLHSFLNVDTLLAELEMQHETKLKQVNKRINRGQNKYIQVEKKTGKWNLPYPTEEPEIENSVYREFGQIDVADLLHLVNQECRFTNAFTPLVGSTRKTARFIQAIFADITAFATNMGVGKMANISDFSEAVLRGAASSFIRLETLKEANDTIVNAASKLPVFKYYNTEEDHIHSSSDGQKFGTRIETFNSRHSSKYFGLGKGVTSYTMVANHIPVNAKIIGAHEHESHYVFDLLFNNSSEIEPQIHSTDTHGTNEINFALLYFFGYQFAPRYKDLSNKTNLIYGFKTPDNYKNSILKPVRRIKTELIKKEWDNILRVLASLALKETTQSVIVSKLASHKRKSDLQKALWEFDNIIKSLYILDYIDDIGLRKNVQKALNRGEAYHRLRKAIPFSNEGKFKVKTELEQQIWGDCARLVANCIIYFNMAVLSKTMILEAKEGDFEKANRLKKSSPVAWQHINLYGRYQFMKADQVLKIDDLIRKPYDIKPETDIESNKMLVFLNSL